MIHFSAPTSPVRQRTRLARQEEILEAARDLVVAHGMEALTLQRVAKDTGCVPAALYRYFPSKEALVAALLGRGLLGLGEAMARRLARWEEGANAHGATQAATLARVLVCVEAFLSWAQAAPHEASLVALGLADPRVLVPQQELALEVWAQASNGVGALLDALQKAQDAHALHQETPVPVMAMLLVGAVMGVWSMQKMARLAPGLIDVEQVARLQARVVLAGLGASESNLGRALSLSQHGETP